MRLLVTGGAGFIGSNLIRRLLRTRDDVEVVNLDLLTYAGNLESLEDVEDDPRYRFVRGDICDAPLVADLVGEVDAVVHLAAETHVDRSILSATPFVRTNVLGTQTLLAASLEAGVERFVQVSTDEVYGELDEGGPPFTEASPVAPRSPYAATKAAADLLALSYHVTHEMDVVVTRGSNSYGPYQFPEKLVPLMITAALEEGELPVYGDGLHVRDWVHVEDHVRALLAALERGRPGRVYNVGGETERANLDVVRAILGHLRVPEARISFVEDRRGHDRRYAVDIGRARSELGWAPEVGFDEGLRATVDWYRDHERWWRRVRSGAYRPVRPG